MSLTSICLLFQSSDPLHQHNTYCTIVTHFVSSGFFVPNIFTQSWRNQGESWLPGGTWNFNRCFMFLDFVIVLLEWRPMHDQCSTNVFCDVDTNMVPFSERQREIVWYSEMNHLSFMLWIISQNVYLWFHWGSSCLLEEWNETISGNVFPDAMVLFEWPPDWMLFLQILYVKLLTCWSKWYELYCWGVGQEITIVCKNMKVCIFGGCVSGLSIPAMTKIFPSSAVFLTWSTSWSVT